MKQQTQVIFTILFPFYLAVILLTNISLTGFWTDVIFSGLLFSVALWIVLKGKINNKRLSFFTKAINSFCAFIVFTFWVLFLINPFTWNTFKLRSFYFVFVNGRCFNAYFKPVGAYAGGEGVFWITETFKYFPLAEREVYYEGAVLYNFNDDTFDGRPADNYEVVRNYIKDEVIDKQK